MKGWGWLGGMIGGLVGIGLGLWIGWGVFPAAVQSEAEPAMLRADYQDEYIFLTAMAYQIQGDPALARERLALLDPQEPTAPLVALIERQIAQGVARSSIAVLVRLAQDLNAATPAMQPYLDLLGQPHSAPFPLLGMEPALCASGGAL